MTEIFDVNYSGINLPYSQIMILEPESEGVGHCGREVADE
jgi:hypothetical protein